MSNIKLTIKYTNQFKKDYELDAKRNFQNE
jgi:mRNA-degrading endonuclease YafQ of YafQ-DinJ toxin-antitoxin module